MPPVPPSARDGGTRRRDTSESGNTDKLPESHLNTVAGVDGPAISLEAAMEIAATGDLWLFRGRKTNDRLVQLATNSPVNHVAMAVAIGDLPPLLWHTESSPSTVDVWTNQRRPGVQLQRLDEAVATWSTRWGHHPFIRQLSPPIDRPGEDELLRVINEFSGRRFPTGRGLAKRWLLGRVRRSAFPDEIFCAELIATTYQRMGLLDDGRPPNWYDPGRFWSGDRVALGAGFSLSAEIAVTVDDAK